MKPLYGEPKVDNYQFAFYYPHYKEKPEMTESTYKSFYFRPLPKLLWLPGALSDYCGWRNLSIAFFLAHNGNACIAKSDMVNGFDLGFVIKQTLNIPFYERQKIDKIR